MKRATIDRPRTIRIWREHNKILHGNKPTDCVCDEQPGRFRKGQKRAGCSRPRCGLCKGHKLFRQPTMQEKKAELALRDWRG